MPQNLCQGPQRAAELATKTRRLPPFFTTLKVYTFIRTVPRVFWGQSGCPIPMVKLVTFLFPTW